MKTILIVLFSALYLSTSLSGQFYQKPVMDKSFIAYVSPISTKEDIMDIISSLNKEGFNVVIEDIAFELDGRLKSFDVSVKPSCNNQSLHKKAIDFSTTSEFPLAAIILNEKCDVNVFTASFDEMTNEFKRHFPTHNPGHIAQAWEGSFYKAKHVTWQASN